MPEPSRRQLDEQAPDHGGAHAGASVALPLSGPDLAARMLGLQAAVGNRAATRWLTRSRTLARKSWHQERTEEVRAALNTDPATWDQPGGAYYLFNGLNKDDQVTVAKRLTASERKLLDDNLAGSKLDRAGMYQSIQQANAASDWWQAKSNEVHAAIRKGDFVSYPNGAYWIINPLNDADCVKIMNFLGADHLDALMDNEEKAVAAGVPNAVSIGEEAAKARAKRKEPARDPLQVVVPGTWVDDFEKVVYDMEYRIEEGGAPSNWMQVHYKDGTKIDLNWYDFDDVTLSTPEVTGALRDRYIGPGGRVFPKRTPKNPGRLGLTRQLCPRLWAMHEEVTDIGAQSTIELMTLSLQAVMIVLTMPTMPVGPAPSTGRVGGRVSRRIVARRNRISVGQAMKMEADFRVEIRRTRDKLVTIPGSTKEAQGGVGPVLSGCLDKRSGEIFYSVNQGKVPTKMHPLLKNRYEAYLAGSGGITPLKAGVPGAHSEVGALNKALWARDPRGRMTVLPEGEFAMHNAALYRNRPEGVPPMCTNCSGIIPTQIKFLP